MEVADAITEEGLGFLDNTLPPFVYAGPGRDRKTFGCGAVSSSDCSSVGLSPVNGLERGSEGLLVTRVVSCEPATLFTQQVEDETTAQAVVFSSPSTPSSTNPGGGLRISRIGWSMTVLLTTCYQGFDPGGPFSPLPVGRQSRCSDIFL